MAEFNEEYWGEIPETEAESHSSETPSLENKSLTVRGSTLYQSATKPVIKEEGSELWMCDPRVLHTIRLLNVARQLRECIQENQFMLGAPAMPAPLSAYPALPNHSFSTWTPPNQITAHEARQHLRRVVAIIAAHMGYEVANETAVWILADIAYEFLQKITKLMRDAVERDRSTGFPDLMERVFCESGLGSMRSIGHWYETRVKKYHLHTLKTVHKLYEKYETLSAQEKNANQQSKRFYVDNDLENLFSVPELHVSSLEGRGQQMEMGLHVLHSLEGGENIYLTPDIPVELIQEEN